MWSKEFEETWKGFSVEAFNYVMLTIKLATPSAIMVWSVHCYTYTHSIMLGHTCTSSFHLTDLILLLSVVYNLAFSY